MDSKADPRYVVFDCETTGLDPAKDGILTIGAVAVRGGEICLDDEFDAILSDWRMTSAVLVHGITQAEAATGETEEQAVNKFLDYVGDAVLVGHHVGFDQKIVAHAAQRLGRDLANPALDTMRIALALEERGAFEGREIRGFDLDNLGTLFDVEPHDRHTASGDAFITAQIFIRLERMADKAGIDLADLIEREDEESGQH
jgi:DNA polymerase-3 subunit epsilon